MSGIPFGRFTGVLVEGVVVAHYPVGHERNPRGPADVYVVDPFFPGLRRLTNCVLAQRIGYRDGLEEQARPMAARTDGGSDLKDSTNRKATDGDRVLIQFINGDILRPVITHFMCHAASGWQTKNDDFKGPVVRRVHNGTSVLFDHEGNIAVTLGDGESPEKPGDSKTVDLKLGEQQQVHMEKDLIKFFEGGKKIATDGTPTTINATTDGTFIGWIAAANTALAAIPGAGPAYTAAVAAAGGLPTTVTGKIDGGSDKLKTD